MGLITTYEQQPQDDEEQEQPDPDSSHLVALYNSTLVPNSLDQDQSSST